MEEFSTNPGIYSLYVQYILVNITQNTITTEPALVNISEKVVDVKEDQLAKYNKYYNKILDHAIKQKIFTY